MESSLFAELKRIGIDEELAAKVSASLDPDYNASKKDVLIMQEAIMQIQLQSERSYQALSSEISTLRTEMHTELAQVRAEVSDVRAEVSEVRAELRTEIAGVRSELRTEIAGVRSEMGAINRQYIITFFTLMTTIASVLAINWYFHQ